MAKQLIYRMELAGEACGQLPSGAEFVSCASPAVLAGRFGVFIRHLGAVGFLKDLVKLGTAARSYDCLLVGDRVVSECYSVVGRCRYYEVEQDAVVMGPAWTDAGARGKGLATGLLKSVMNRHMGEGRRVFYIDTSEKNVAMQRVIEGCGFGAVWKRVEKCVA